jgi:cell division protein ZapA
MESVRIQILGQVYNIKGQDDPGYIRELAALLDAKMKEIQKGTGTIEPHRVAILTALTISDELYRLQEKYRVLERSAEEATKRLLNLTEHAANE